MSETAVHDVLRVDPALASAWNAPAWVAPALARAPWVVVRRAREAGGIAAGVRGRTRGERFAARIAACDVRERRTPEELAQRAISHASAHDPQLAALTALARAAGALAVAAGMSWGIGGSLGFELASGVRVTHAASDLDLIVRIATLPSRAQIAALRPFADGLAALGERAGRRIDVELLAADVGIALGDAFAADRTVFVKSAHGPRLIALAS